MTDDSGDISEESHHQRRTLRILNTRRHLVSAIGKSQSLLLKLENESSVTHQWVLSRDEAALLIRSFQTGLDELPPPS